MYNILVVDDDSFFKSMFINNFDWESRGFHIAARADNGLQAIDLLQHTDIDLAFIDMVMPSMNGPELIAYIKRHYPHIVCYALSNYDDFDFVKGSFRAGATDYVLKHCLNQEETCRMLEGFLDMKRSSDGSGHTSSAGSAQHDEDAAAHFLSALIEGRFLQRQEDHMLIDALRLPPLRRNILLFRTEIVHFEDFRRKYYLLSRLRYTLRSVCSIMKNIMEHHANGTVFFNRDDDGFYTILYDDRFENPAFAEHTSRLYMQQVSSALKMYFNVDCKNAVSSLVRDVRDISQAYREVTTKLGVQTKTAVAVDTEAVYARAMISLKYVMSTGAIDRLDDYIGQFFKEVQHLCYTREDHTQLAATIFRAYLACCGSIPENVGEAFAALLNCREADEMLALLVDNCRKLRPEGCGGGSCVRSEHVQKAIDMIARQYALPQLSLTSIAEAIHVSDSYLSRSFKTETGTGLTEYIGRYRIERAKVMLAIEQANVKTVSAKCGFDNYTYFFRIFKKYTGMTPREFCESVGLSEIDRANDRGESIP